MKTIAVGLSGGVDSTLAALLLKEQGHTLIGLSMSIYNKDIPALKPSGKSCYGPEEKQDIRDIQQWARGQGFESRLIDLSEEYKEIVLKYFKEAYLAGLTPNPCIVCNQKMKFGVLLDKALSSGVKFDYFATGHYVRLEKIGDRFVIRRAVDERKDQSYFLYRLTQEQLSKVMFPLGAYTKDEVRDMARARGLEVAEKADSQDFYGGDYADLLQQSPKIGQIVHTSGKVLGTHQGFWHYTIGQRKGLGIAYSEPLFVVDIIADDNVVVVGTVNETLSRECYAHDCNWVGLAEAPKTPIKVMAKYRSAGRSVPASIVAHGDSVKIVFDEAQKSITRGQSVVFYGALDGQGNIVDGAGEYVLGGGVLK